MNEPRIGAFICHCGGNISDYVDVERVRDEIAGEEGVVHATTSMFTCSDAAQQDIIDAIKEHRLDGIVVASCSPKLHLSTFRAMAKRAGLNPYVYNQVNIREQCSWTHTNDIEGATRKAVSLIRAGIARTRTGRPLQTIRVDTTARVLVVGAGVAGLRSALSLSDMGLEVHLVEKRKTVGGNIAEWGTLFPENRKGHELIERLLDRVKGNPNITLYTGAEVTGKTGSVGDFEVQVTTHEGSTTTLNVGSIVVATGFDHYTPSDGEYGFGEPGVLSLTEFRGLVDATPPGEELRFRGKPVRDVVYIYCVGSRQAEGCDNCHTYCSRYCCTAAVHTGLLVADNHPNLRQFHLFRDMRTYGKQELLYDEALRRSLMFLKFPDEEPPGVSAKDGRLQVTVRDQLTSGEEIEIETDLVVLVTGMEPRVNDGLVDVLKIPVGKDGFFNEIHPKLRPVETVMDGVFIAGAAQGPKNVPESAASAMAASAKTAALLLKGYIDLEPFIAAVDPDRCTWCGACAEACPYAAIGVKEHEGKQIAAINPALCKGCGGCVPICEPQALGVEGYTNRQVTAMIDALAEEVA